MNDDAQLPELITVDALHQFAYCPRRAFLMHVEGLMAHNEWTEDGKRVHRRVDQVDHVLNAPEEGAEGGEVGDSPPAIARSVALTAADLGLTGKLDLVSTANEEAVPVETKRGTVPSNAEQSWEPERVQLMAQALLLRAHGWHCDHGFIYYAGSKRRVEVRFDQQLEDLTRELIQRARAQAGQTHLPDPLEASPKCNGCSLSGICLPDETIALRHAAVDVAPSSEQRRLYPPRSDAAPLYVQQQGATVGTRKGTLVIRKSGELIGEARLKDVDHLVLCGNVQIGAQALQLLLNAGIPVCHMSMGHWFYGFTIGFAVRNAYNKVAQFEFAGRPSSCLTFAKEITAAKIANQRTLLMRNARPRPDRAINSLASLHLAARAASDPQALLGIEGAAARHYFENFSRMLTVTDASAQFQAAGRVRRPPTDPVNTCLSFGYALLTKECTVALAAVGLDPFWGFFHQPRHGKPALALDLMEEFRPLIVDSAVLTALNTSMLSLKDFVVGRSGCAMRDTARKAFIRAYENRLEQLVTHPFLGYRVSWRTMIRVQARLLSRWLRGDIERYQAIQTR